MAFDLERFNRQVYTATTELVDQEVNRFNAASGGAIVLSPSNANQGDFTMRAGFQLISGLVRRRDVMNGGNAVAPVRLTHLKNVSVKVASGTPPVVFEPAQYEWIKRSPAEAALVIGEQLAKAMVQDQLNAVLGALNGVLAANAAVRHTETGSLTLPALTEGAAKFGDRAGSIAAWVMHSKSMTDLRKQALINVERLFTYQSVNILRDPEGRVFVVTDSPSLVSGGTYASLGLVRGAATVEPNNDFNAVLVDMPGSENIQRTYQAEWSYNVGLLGYAWDPSTGGSAPADTALASATSWVQTATSIKDTAGVIVISS